MPEPKPSVPRTLADAIPVTADCVLALGPDAELAGEDWRRRAPTARWIALDEDAAASPAALQAALDGARPDCLVLGDVSGQAAEPGALLRQLVPHLAEGAAAVLSFANPGHWSSVARGLRHRWEAEGPPGAPTPGPAFTLEDAKRLLERAGLTLVKTLAERDPKDEEGGKPFVETLSGLAGALGEESAELTERLTTRRHILVAVKGSPPPKLHIQQLVMVPRFMAVRVEQPLAALDSLPCVETASSERFLPRLTFPEGTRKLLIIQRQIILDPGLWLPHVHRLSSEGWLLIAEWDDHPELLPRDSRAKWEIHGWLPIEAVHAVQTSTEGLAEAFRAHNPTVAVFENALATLPPLPEKSERWLRILFAALNREDVNDWLAPLLNRVLADYPQTQIAVIHNEPLYEALEVAKGRKSFRTSLSYPAYLNAIAGAHIALLPLAGSRAESFKSDVKFIECASRGTVCIASPLLYEDRILDGERGLIARSPEEWLAALRRLIEDRSLRERLASNAYAYCREERMLTRQTQARHDWYRALTDRQPELHKALMARIAGR